MTRLKTLLAATVASLCIAGTASAQSAYGCEALDDFHILPSVEGTDGVFFRVNPDLRNFHPFSDYTVTDVARLAQALDREGTRLVFAPIPMKSLVMTDHLPQKAYDYGFDPILAATVYDDMIDRLSQAGVTAINVRRALAVQGRGQDTFFKTDPRLNALGLDILADAISQGVNGGGPTVRAPGLAEAEADSPRATRVSEAPQRSFGRTTFRERLLGRNATTSTPPPAAAPTPARVTERATPARANVMEDGTRIESRMRTQLQRHCALELPQVTISEPSTEAQGTRGGAGAIVVAGSEFTGTPELGFRHRLAQRMGGQVQTVWADDAGAFGGISAYMTSDAFLTARPRVLVWEVPVYQNISRYGDRPMAELMAAASGTCRSPLPLSPDASGALAAPLNGLRTNADTTLLLDTGSQNVRKATFTFRNGTGLARTRTVARTEGVPSTGRFYVPLTGLWEDGVTAVEVSLDAPAGARAQLSICAN